MAHTVKIGQIYMINAETWRTIRPTQKPPGKNGRTWRLVKVCWKGPLIEEQRAIIQCSEARLQEIKKAEAEKQRKKEMADLENRRQNRMALWSHIERMRRKMALNTRRY